jgi:hypothetical protein
MLGNTFSPESLPNLKESLANSLSHASKLLTFSTEPVTDGVTYSHVATRIRELINKKDEPIPVVVVAPPTPVEPVFDFMVESKLNIAEESAKKTASPTTAKPAWNGAWGDEPSPSLKGIAVSEDKFTPLTLQEPVIKAPAWVNGPSSTIMSAVNVPDSKGEGRGGRNPRKPKGDKGATENKPPSASSDKGGERKPRSNDGKPFRNSKPKDGKEGGERPKRAEGGEGKDSRAPRREGGGKGTRGGRGGPRGPAKEGAADSSAPAAAV